MVEWKLGEETEVLKENLLQCHFVHHVSHMTWAGIEPGWKSATNSLSYGTTLLCSYLNMTHKSWNTEIRGHVHC
jgi:hypothetical protein